MSSMSSNQNVLYTPTECGALKLKNRIVYPAMTRARCPGRTVNSEMVKYYTARSSAGMIVTEPSAVCEGANGYSDAPGMYTEEHATAWAEVTKALHANYCTVVAQLWHTGRMSHSSFLGGKQVVSASALPIVPRHGSPACGVQGADGGWHAHEEPRGLSTAEVEEVVEAFGLAAELAKKAGFDGVELHAGSGYLLDTFLQSCSNAREDKYGGDAKGRFTLLEEIVTRVCAVFPAAAVGVKLSPNNGFNGMGSADNAATFQHAAAQLHAMGVGYLHVVDGVGKASDDSWFGRVSSSGFHNVSAGVGLADLKQAFPGAIIGNGGYDAESAAAAVASGAAAAISFGRLYMTNPDLVERFQSQLPLAELPPQEHWFEPSDKTRADLSWGYTQYAAHADGSTTKAKVLHMLGSPTSGYYEKLSLMYAQGCAAANEEYCSEEYEFVYCMVHPGRTWSFPADLQDETVAQAKRYSAGEGVGKLAALGAAVCQSHMFCHLGVSTYRSVLDLLNVPFVGGSVAAMGLTENKGKTRAIVKEAGVPVAEGEVLRRGMRPSLSPPYVLKPCSEDNSMGLHVVRGEAEVEGALADAFNYDDEVICEAFVPPGRELRFGVLEDDEGNPTIALPGIEYFLSADKPVRTSNDKTHVDEFGRPLKFAKPSRQCPADLDAALVAKLTDAAQKAHVALGCRDYSLYDFRVDPQGNIFMLEATLFCCFAPNSVICLMATATAKPELQPQALFKTMLRRARARKLDLSEGASQVFGSKPKPMQFA